MTSEITCYGCATHVPRPPGEPSRPVQCRRVWRCDVCGELKSCDNGGADDLPLTCDECWSLLHNEYPEAP